VPPALLPSSTDPRTAPGIADRPSSTRRNPDALLAVPQEAGRILTTGSWITITMLMTQPLATASANEQHHAHSFNSRSRTRSRSNTLNNHLDVGRDASRSHSSLGRNRLDKAQQQQQQQSYAHDMNGILSAAPPGALYVRALYDYDADDRTSLSFHEGDIIQVITQLESGWWDGVINGVRGWFPSNYCQIISSTEEIPDQVQHVDTLDHFEDKQEDSVAYVEEEFDDAGESDFEGRPSS